MNKDMLKRGFDKLGPTAQQKERMMRNTQEKLQREQQGTFESRPVKAGLWPVAASAAVLLLVIFSGIFLLRGSGTDGPALGQSNLPGNTQPQPSTEAWEQPDQAEQTPSAAEQEAIDSQLQQLLGLYRTAITEKWDRQSCEEADISYMVTFLSEPGQLGYWLSDWNEDSVQELIISDGNVIYDLYCLDGKQVRHIITGAERNAYMLCRDGSIRNTASNGAAESCYSFYTLKNCRLELCDEVRFNACTLGPACSHLHHASKDHDHSEQHAYHNGCSVSVDAALGTVNSYVPDPIPITPIG